jgi:methylglyoxal synthase
MEPCLALIAHEGKNPEILAFALRHTDLLRRCSLLATETTGRLLIAETGMRIECVRSGPTGAYAQVGARVVMGEVDAVIFLVDLLDRHPREPEARALLAACNLYGVPLATSPMTARLLLGALFQPQLTIR